MVANYNFGVNYAFMMILIINIKAAVCNIFVKNQKQVIEQVHKTSVFKTVPYLAPIHNSKLIIMIYNLYKLSGTISWEIDVIFRLYVVASFPQTKRSIGLATWLLRGGDQSKKSKTNAEMAFSAVR